MSTTVPHRQLLTVSETATRLRVSEKTVRRLIDAEILPALRVGLRAIRVDESELEQWLYADDLSLAGSRAAPDPVAALGRPLRGREHGGPEAA